MSVRLLRTTTHTTLPNQLDHATHLLTVRDSGKYQGELAYSTLTQALLRRHNAHVSQRDSVGRTRRSAHLPFVSLDTARVGSVLGLLS